MTRISMLLALLLALTVAPLAYSQSDTAQPGYGSSQGTQGQSDVQNTPEDNRNMPANQGSDIDADRDLGVRDEESTTDPALQDEGIDQESRDLPATAGPLPLIGLLGLLSVAGAVGTRFARK